MEMTKEQEFIDFVEEGKGLYYPMPISCRGGGFKRAYVKFYCLDTKTNNGVLVGLEEGEDFVGISLIKATIFSKGYGTQFMKWICKLADEKGIILKVDPYPQDEKVRVNKLKRWYKRFGFKPNKGEYIRVNQDIQKD